MKPTQNSISKKEQYWRYHIDSWQKSGRSQKAYCSSHGLALATFGYWKKKLDKFACSKPRFYPLTIQSHPQEHSAAESGKLILQIQKYKLEICEGFTSDHLKKVINTLEQLP